MKATTRRGFIRGTAAIIVTASSKPTNADSKSTADLFRTMPQFIRELIADVIGVSLETINDWIDSGDKDAQERMCNAIEILGAQVRVLEWQRRGGAS